MPFFRKKQPTWKIGLTLSQKAKKVLHLILLAFILISIRVWHLSFIQQSTREKEFHKPRQKTVIEQGERGMIVDRFGKALALNQVKYTASVSYGPIRHIPRVGTIIENGRKKKIYRRKEYITKLSAMLAEILHMDSERIEDLIYAKASILSDAPFVLKEDISEEQYYRLKALENDWPGLSADRIARRFYPLGRVAGDIIGYMGAINQQEYSSFYEELQNLRSLQKNLEAGRPITDIHGYDSLETALYRLKNLEDKAFFFHDVVGKSGIEGLMEEQLRGYHGKRVYLSDAKGNYLRKLPGGRDKVAGKQVTLTLSADLQAYAEQLLIDNERAREGRSVRYDPIKGSFTPYKQPWIKGGAIVVLDPNNGEVLALASYPRFDPNTFVSTGDLQQKKEKHYEMVRQFETEEYLSAIWDQVIPLKRERTIHLKDIPFDEEQFLTLDAYLTRILPEDSEVITALRKIHDIRGAYNIQQSFQRLLELSEQESAFDLLKYMFSSTPHYIYPSDPLNNEQIEWIRSHLYESKDEANYLIKNLAYYLDGVKKNYDKCLVIDLCRLLVCSDSFNENLLEEIGSQTLSDYRQACASFAVIDRVVKQLIKDAYHDFSFKFWRDEHGKSFLKEKRKEELKKNVYAKPYLDYFDKEEAKQFDAFWQSYRFPLITEFLGFECSLEHPCKDWSYYRGLMRQWHAELSEGAYEGLDWKSAYRQLRMLMGSLSNSMAHQYLTTLRAFSDLNRPLLGRYRHIRPFNHQKESDLAKAFYPPGGFGYGRSYAFRQATPQGSIFKLVTAYEALRQRYHNLKGQIRDLEQLNPMTIIDDLHLGKQGKWNIGYTLSGHPIPQHYKGGRLPRSYRSGIGKIDLFTAMEISSNPYFALLAEDFLENPEDLIRAAADFSYGEKTGIELPGEISGYLPKDVAYNKTGLYATAIGQHSIVVTPLQTAVMLSTIANGGYVLKPKIVQGYEGRQLSPKDSDLLDQNQYSFQETLNQVGINFPLFTAFQEAYPNQRVQFEEKESYGRIDLPPQVRDVLLDAMRSVVRGHTSLPAWKKIRSYDRNSPLVQDLKELSDEMVGKTSTAELVASVDVDLDKGTNIYKHVWFGGIAFPKDSITSREQGGNWGKPELVVVVYLQYADYGKEAIPLAAQMIKKWRELKEQSLTSS